MRRILHWLRQVVSSFWFVPVMCLVISVVLAEALVALDRAIDYGDEPDWVQPVFVLGVDGARGLLSMIGGSTFAAAATAFSITISVIVTASTNYGPRLVGNFMSDRRNQFTLGALVSTFVYSILVIRTIRSLDDGSVFVPHIAVNTAIIFALIDVLLLVSFIHHIASNTQVASLTASMAGSFNRALEDLRARSNFNSLDADVPVGGTLVTARKAGVVIQLDEQALLDAATACGGQVILEVGIGDRVVEGTPVARVIVGSEDDSLQRAVLRGIDLGSRHAPDTDIRYAQQQVLELAVRALSTGTNDPYTAVAVIEDLTPQMVRLVSAPKPPAVIGDDNDVPRLFLRAMTMEELIDVPFNHILPFVGSQPVVYHALVDLAGHMEQHIAHKDLRGRAFRHVERMRTTITERGDVSLEVFDARVERNQRLIDLARRPAATSL